MGRTACTEPQCLFKGAQKAFYEADRKKKFRRQRAVNISLKATVYGIIEIEIYLLTASGLTPGGGNTVHIYTQTIHKKHKIYTQTIQKIHKIYTQTIHKIHKIYT